MVNIILEDSLNLDIIQNGRVKWFNNKAGYGFITINTSENSTLDVFVHHSSIKVENLQYKYLIQGEYVDFKLFPVNDDKYKYQASEVSGINSGKLMCETRREYKITRLNYKNLDPENSIELKNPILSKPNKPRRVKVDKNIDTNEKKSDWIEVKKTRKITSKINNSDVLTKK